jgi:hypothetical protein
VIFCQGCAEEVSAVFLDVFEALLPAADTLMLDAAELFGLLNR